MATLQRSSQYNPKNKFSNTEEVSTFSVRFEIGVLSLGLLPEYCLIIPKKVSQEALTYLKIQLSHIRKTVLPTSTGTYI